MSYLLVIVGSAAGGLARFVIGTWLQRRLDDVVPHGGVAMLPFPIGTLIVNVSGSFLLGALLVVIAKSGSNGDSLRWLLAIGFCGGYTTFSTFSADTVALVESGGLALAAWNVAASLALAFGATLLGATIARQLTS